MSREYFELIEEANSHLQYPFECDSCGFFTNDYDLINDDGCCRNCDPEGRGFELPTEEEESEEEQEEQAVYESSTITTEDGTVHTSQFRVFDSQ